jgi:hypothetical protein
MYPARFTGQGTLLNTFEVDGIRFTSLQFNSYDNQNSDQNYTYFISKASFENASFQGLATSAHTSLSIFGGKALRLTRVFDLAEPTQRYALPALVVFRGAVAEFEFFGKRSEIETIANSAGGLFAIDGIICIVEEIRSYSPVDGKGILVCRLVPSIGQEKIPPPQR